MTAWLATLLRLGTGALRAHFRLDGWDERRAKIILGWTFGDTPDLPADEKQLI